MLTFLGLVHIFVAVLLIGLVLIQDSKGGMGALGGGSSNTVLGASGAENILAKLTRWVAIVFAVSCVILTIYTSTGSRSVVDGMNLPKADTATTAPAAPATTETKPAEESPKE